MRHIDEIIVHCSATPDGRHVTVADIDAWHRQNGWNGIGYHFVIYLDGSIHEGRPVSRVGAHVAGRNSKTIGVCYIGGTDARGRAQDTRTPEQVRALQRLLVDLVRAHPSVRKISGHRDYANKACPSFDATAEFAGLIEQVRGKPVASVPPAFDGGRYRVTAREANFRDGPGGNVKGSLRKGHVVQSTGNVAGGWIEVVSPAGYRGWMHGSVLVSIEVTEDLSRSRTVHGASAAGVGGFGILGDGATQLAGDLQRAEYHFSAGTFLQLAIGALIVGGAAWALYARWDDAGRPVPWGKKRGARQ